MSRHAPENSSLGQKSVLEVSFWNSKMRCAFSFVFVVIRLVSVEGLRSINSDSSIDLIRVRKVI